VTPNIPTIVTAVGNALTCASTPTIALNKVPMPSFGCI